LILSTAKRDDIWHATVTDENGKLIACSFSKHKNAAENSAIESLPRPLRKGLARSKGNSKIVGLLHEIYMGRSSDRTPSVVFLTTSKFLRHVYETTMRIPKGKVTTYGRLARQAGSKRGSRAVGNAMARNPLPLIVPCHRVVLSTLRLGNYGAAGVEKGGGSLVKRQLLLREGVDFDGAKVSQGCVWDPR